MNALHDFVVLYREREALPYDPPLAFACQAEDADHAEEQCQDAEPEARVAWIVQTHDPEVAIADYYKPWGDA
jgi:hypothetical protein